MFEFDNLLAESSSDEMDEFDNLLTEFSSDIVDSYISEGANRDIKNYFKQAKKKYREEMKEVKRCQKSNDKKGAIEHLDNAKEIINKYGEIISDVDSNVLEDILGYMLRDLIQAFKLLPLSIATCGIINIVSWVNDLINLIRQYEKDGKSNKDEISRLNIYRSSTLAIIDKYNKKIEAIKKEIEYDS